MNSEAKILSRFIFTAVVLIVLGAYSFRINRERDITSKMVTHTNEVLYNVGHMLVAALDIEVGQTGFEITGDENFLEPYLRGTSVVYNYLYNIRRLTKDNGQQQKKLDTLTKLISAEAQFAKESIEAKRNLILNQSNPSYGALEKQTADNGSTDKSTLKERFEAKVVMDQIRRVTENIQNEEKRLLAVRMDANEIQVTKFTTTFVGLLFLVIVILTSVYLIMRANLKAVRRFQEKSTAFRDLLEASIESQKEVLMLSVDMQYKYLFFNSSQKMNTLQTYGTSLEVGMDLFESITNSEDKGKIKSNVDRALAGESHFTIEEFGNLERHYFETFYSPIFNRQHNIIGATAFSSNITERMHAEEDLLKVTEELRVANKELDAFCYSVSHDLRAPLRSINGYARILLEDYAGKLDQAGQNSLDVVVNSARKMGELIDDLLSFSQVGKTVLSKAMLQMERTANDVATEQLRDIGNNVSMQIHPLHQGVGDPSLIKQVWVNLISNAIKYSSKNASPKIEIGSRKEQDSIVYYVKDNGVGFDMAYAHKLFGVFQRLHRSSDFEGTGVGLSIVNRIIARHGGKVWAEGKPDEGAIFYFSLPN